MHQKIRREKRIEKKTYSLKVIHDYNEKRAIPCNDDSIFILSLEKNECVFIAMVRFKKKHFYINDDSDNMLYL